MIDDDDLKRLMDFEILLVGANWLAKLDGRPPVNRAIAETFFHEMNFSSEEIERLDGDLQAQTRAAYQGVGAFYDLLLYLRMDTLPGDLFKHLIDKQFQRQGSDFKVPVKVHRKLLSELRKRLAGAEK